MAACDSGVSYDHFIILLAAASGMQLRSDKLVAGDDAWLIIDDTALPKKGRHSVGVAPQYASSLGKTANCQSLVSVTLASREVPVLVGMPREQVLACMGVPGPVDPSGVRGGERGLAAGHPRGARNCTG